MSIILAAISKNNDIAVCSDGRATDSNGKVVGEYEQKIYKINKKCIIGWTGTAAKYLKLKDYVKDNFSSDQYNVNQIHNSCIKYLEKNKSDESDVHILITGYDEECNPHLYVISASSTILSRDYNDIKRTILGDVFCNYILNETEDDINKILDSMEECIINRAMFHFLINKNVSKLHLLVKDVR